MAFHNMPDLGPMVLPGANEYGREFTDLARKAATAHAVEMDIAYGPDPFQRLDVWLPQSGAPGGEALGALPVVLFIHGGAFRNGHKEWIGAMAPVLTALPAVLVSPNYRLVPRVKVPDAVADCFNALAWVHRNIARYGGDPMRLFVGGHSAGGHLAAMLALRVDERTRLGVPAEAVRGCLPVSAVFSMRREDHAPDSLVTRFWDQMLGDEAAARATTAATYAAGEHVPFYIAQGDAEPPEVASTNAEMISLTRRHGFLFDMDVFANADHFDAHRRCNDPDGTWMRKVRRMVEQYG